MNEAQKTKPSSSVVHLHPASYDLFIFVLTVFSLLVVAGLLILPPSPAVNAVLLRVDFVICMLFLLDFLFSLARGPNRAANFFRQRGWLDLLGSIPAMPGLSWTAIFRLARLNRLVQIIKHLQGKDRDQVVAEARETLTQTALLTTIILAIMLITIASLFILGFERGVSGVNITTGADAFWWAIVTMTTVGYGDHVPITYPGRMLAIVLMTFGVGIFAVLTSFVASRMVVLQDDRRPDQEDMASLVREENAMIRAELAEIKGLLKGLGAIGDDEA